MVIIGFVVLKWNVKLLMDEEWRCCIMMYENWWLYNINIDIYYLIKIIYY